MKPLRPAFSFSPCSPRLALCALILLLSACGASAPTRYHTLLDTPSGAQASISAKFFIDVLPVSIPAQVDRPQLVVRDGGGVLPLEQERWIAPLADEARAALSADLSRELGATDIAGQPRPVGARVLTIRVDLRRFESVPGAYAAVDAVWSLNTDGATSSPLVCTASAHESTGQGYDELVRAHRRALANLAGRTASAAQAYMSGRKDGCTSG
ncbi:MAG: membrane integrity-associated transporter subunit PqiC [Rudaea sp.]|uniref:PqiC family protein n=1 Tax=Rudaea sp. 3F27F6 TaxID=2502208 RepID=UPI0010F9342C|nr:PqiC family protein [Rudaea sp. 3F27F6]MBR0347730.1 membrane integrity-associated transporter subunit PqiC [Rudaea sp.]